jgi:peroxiredoxin
MSNLAHLKFNDPAPDVQVLDTEGNPVQLSSYWRKHTVVLAFTRHFGCPQCKEMLDELNAARPEFEAHGLDLVIVTQGSPEQAKAFCADRAPGAICLADPDRQAYSAYGIGRGTLYQTLISPNIWRSNKQLKETKGITPEPPPPGQDAFIMSATFIIGADGLIRLPYYYEDIADHPPVELLLKGFVGMDWSKPIVGTIQPEHEDDAAGKTVAKKSVKRKPAGSTKRPTTKTKKS